MYYKVNKKGMTTNNSTGSDSHPSIGSGGNVGEGDVSKKKGRAQTIMVKYLDTNVVEMDEKFCIQIAGFSDRKPLVLQVWHMPCSSREDAEGKLKDLLVVWDEKKTLIIIYA